MKFSTRKDEIVPTIKKGASEADLSRYNQAMSDVMSKNYRKTREDLDKLKANTPVGEIKMYGGATAPEGFILCDGTSYLRSDYVDLFAVIGTTYGSVDGTHFNVPDMRGVFPKGAGTTTRTAGKDASGNYYTATLGAYAQDKMQGHYHRLTGTGSKDGSGVNGTWTDYMMRDGKDDGTYSNDGEVQIPVADGTNDTPRTGHTTEPQSLGVTFIIKY